ncbi:hypothetical protein [Flavobacterium sp.]|uniref:hypothetical protein n=1 Tax=Flavobacterium sp. TaxID=239 RepID=UPI0026051A5D|nr:hypothetical protein [Flavobacterium sp.]
MDRVFALLRAFRFPVVYIIMGLYLIQKEDRLAKIIGYANIIFWFGLMTTGVVKIIYDHIKKNKTTA